MKIKTKQLIIVFIAIMCTASLVGCSDNEIVDQHIGEAIAQRGDVAYYASIDYNERESLCEEKHIEVSGIVTKSGNQLFYIGDKKTDGLKISLTFDDEQEKLDQIEKGDYIVAHGVCTSISSNSMYLSGCKLIEITENGDNDSSARKEIPNDDIKKSTEHTMIAAPIASYDCEGRKYDEVEAIFRDVGFENILLKAVKFDPSETQNEDGDVIIVGAGDKAIFEKGEKLDPNVEIAIGYAIVVESTEKESTQMAKTELEVEEPSYSTKDMTAIMYATSIVNVRSGPDRNEAKLGTLSTNEEVDVTGQVENGWYRIKYNGEEGFVKGDFLSTEKQAINEVSKDTGSGSGEPNVRIPQSEDTEGNLVWVPTKGGKKYHSKSSCSNMEDPIQVTIEHAEANGYTPCKRCH